MQFNTQTFILLMPALHNSMKGEKMPYSYVLGAGIK